jgi:hypothetical protein
MQQQAEISPSLSRNEADTSGGTNNEASTIERPTKERGIRFIAILSVSMFLCLIFIYSSTVQANDTNGTQWLVFYAFHAIIPASFMIDVFFHFPHILIYAFATIMFVWSLVFLVISCIEIFKPQSQTYLGDNNITQSQQLIFDLAGSLLTLVSVIYHVARLRFLDQKKRNEVEIHSVMS